MILCRVDNPLSAILQLLECFKNLGKHIYTTVSWAYRQRLFTREVSSASEDPIPLHNLRNTQPNKCHNVCSFPQLQGSEPPPAPKGRVHKLLPWRKDLLFWSFLLLFLNRAWQGVSPCSCHFTHSYWLRRSLSPAFFSLPTLVRWPVQVLCCAFCCLQA